MIKDENNFSKEIIEEKNYLKRKTRRKFKKSLNAKTQLTEYVKMITKFCDINYEIKEGNNYDGLEIQDKKIENNKYLFLINSKWVPLEELKGESAAELLWMYELKNYRSNNILFISIIELCIEWYNNYCNKLFSVYPKDVFLGINHKGVLHTNKDKNLCIEEMDEDESSIGIGLVVKNEGKKVERLWDISKCRSSITQNFGPNHENEEKVQINILSKRKTRISGNIDCVLDIGAENTHLRRSVCKTFRKRPSGTTTISAFNDNVFECNYYYCPIKVAGTNNNNRKCF